MKKKYKYENRGVGREKKESGVSITTLTLVFIKKPMKD